MTRSAPRASYDLMSETLRDVLRTAVDGGPGEAASVAWRASAALYELLCAHPIDHRGRCRSCWRPGARLGRRRRRCRVYRTASYWLRQPDEVLLLHLARELDQGKPTAEPGG